MVVSVAGQGVSVGNAGFEYVDLWSNVATWGGSSLPGEGDSVYIPVGTSVLLDVSPPPLFTLVVAGNLRFSEEVGDLHLQVRARGVVLCGG